MTQAFDKAGCQTLATTLEKDLAGAPDRATVAVAVLQIGELDGDLVAPFFRCDRKTAAGRGQAELRHAAAVFAAAARDPNKRPLIEKKEQLEQAIDKLKFEKAAMAVAEYKRQLTQLLLELAKTQEALDK